MQQTTTVYLQRAEDDEEASEPIAIALQWQGGELGSAALLSVGAGADKEETPLRLVAQWAEKGVYKFAVEGAQGEYIAMQQQADGRLCWYNEPTQMVREELDLQPLKGQGQRVQAAVEWCLSQINALLKTKFAVQGLPQAQAGAALESNAQTIDGAAAHLLLQIAPAPSLPRIALVSDGAGVLVQAGVDVRQWGKTTQYRGYVRCWRLI